MTTLKFKTTINCNHCLRTVTPFLNEVEGAKSWSVDTNNPDKILTVNADGNITSAIVEAVEEAGFDIEILPN